MKPHASGLYCLLPGDEPPNLYEHACLEKDIDGFRLRMPWWDVQPSNSGEYCPETIDEAIEIAAAHGKSIGLSVSGGLKTPEWVYGAGGNHPVYKYVYTETDPHIKPPQSVGNSPLVWDQQYQKISKQFVRWLGERYDPNPNVAYVFATHFMQIVPMMVAKPMDEPLMCELAQSPPTGYPGLNAVYTDHIEAWTQAACWFIDLWMRAFPTTPVLVTLNPPFESEEGKQAQNMVRDYGLENYPQRFGTHVAARYAEEGTRPADTVPYPKGSQFAYNAHKQHDKQYKKPAPDPIPQNPQCFIDTIDAACSKADKFVECYEVDLIENEDSVLAECRAKLNAMAS